MRQHLFRPIIPIKQYQTICTYLDAYEKKCPFALTFNCTNLNKLIVCLKQIFLQNSFALIFTEEEKFVRLKIFFAGHVHFHKPSIAIIFTEKNWRVWTNFSSPELKALEWSISGLMLNPLFFLISRLNIAGSPHELNLQIS